MKPDAIIAVDVNHDYVAAPGIGDKRFTPLEMGKGFTMSVSAIASERLNRFIETAALEHNIPLQRDVCGRDTGTDGMAGVLASVDAAATSIGFPTRNMHTISEVGNTSDVLASIHVITLALQAMDAADDGKGSLRAEFENNHPRLDEATSLGHQGSDKKED